MIARPTAEEIFLGIFLGFFIFFSCGFDVFLVTAFEEVKVEEEDTTEEAEDFFNARGCESFNSPEHG